jgi:hypothetical protein
MSALDAVEVCGAASEGGSSWLGPAVALVIDDAPPRSELPKLQESVRVISRAVSVVNVASRLLNQIPVSLEYIVIASTTADFRG